MVEIRSNAAKIQQAPANQKKMESRQKAKSCCTGLRNAKNNKTPHSPICYRPFFYKLNISSHPHYQKVKMVMKLSLFAAWLLLLTVSSEANQVHKLREFVKSRRPWDSTRDSHWEDMQSKKEHSPVYIGPQEGLMQGDKISSLPGEPDGVDFDQYAGYVTVDPDTGRALFYYFVESPQNSSTNPLVLWLNGGPGCSSLGFGAMEELGPFRVNSDGKTLFRNSYAWNNVANVIFLESPAGVGFSYSNTSSDYDRNGDESTAEDAYTFLVNWLERFPQYKTRDFYITGESYSGHYVPQLAYNILLNNNTNNTTINLKGIAIGNALIDHQAWISGVYEYVWTHALISDETHKGIATYCGDFVNMTSAEQCEDFTDRADNEQGDIDSYNIYFPLCHGNRLAGSVDQYDPCSDDYVFSYLNTPEVQKAFHANPIHWEACGGPYNGSDTPSTVLPIIKTLMASDLRVWIYSGDVDSVVPVTSTRYSMNTFNLPVKNVWRPWYINKEVGGYVETYEEGLTFVTIRGAGHAVPSYQPERALTMISSFLQGTLPPSFR